MTSVIGGIPRNCSNDILNQWEGLRKIIHVDMDAFYASVEQRDDPSLLGKPVVVGGKPNSRGVVSTASYEARRFGIHSAMSMTEAYRCCPEAIFLPVNMKKYKDVSIQIREIFLTYTPLVEPLSLDEAFLDVTGSTSLFGSVDSIAMKIKDRIKEELGLTASVGIASNKFLAKLASDLQKPDGFVLVRPDKIQEFLDPLSIERLWGVGKRTSEELHKLNVRKIKELRNIKSDYLIQQFGVLGSQLYQLARGIDERPVENERVIKSIGRETTFLTDVIDVEVLETTLLELAVDVGRRLRQESLKGKTITLKIRYDDFKTLSRSQTLEQVTDLDEIIFHEARTLLRNVSLTKPIRLLGVTMNNLSSNCDCQLALFSEEDSKSETLAKVIDAVNQKFGKKGIVRARLL